MTDPAKPKPPHDHRATDKGLGKKVGTIEDQLDRGAARMGEIERALADNTAATREVLEIVSMGKSFFRVLGVIGSGVKWLAGMATVVAAAYAAWTHK